MINMKYSRNFLDKKKDILTIATHDSEFHADEVVAVSLIKFVFGAIKVIRTREVKKLSKADIVVDVGGEYNPSLLKFDHHQKKYGGTLASAGMVLKWLKDDGILDVKFTNHLNNLFVRGVDLQDIGKYHPQRGFCTFSTVISSFNPSISRQSEKEFFRSFMQAVDFTVNFIESIKEKYIENKKFRHKFLSVLQDGYSMQNNILILEEYIPWKEFIYEKSICKNVLLVVMRVSRNKWILSTVPLSPKKPYSDRMKLPLNWAGLLEDEFYKKTEIKGGIFCHKQRFMAAFKSKKAVLKAASIAIKEYQQEKKNKK